MQVNPTPTGQAHAAIQLGATLEESEERWGTLPLLSTINPLYQVKPGASVLLTGTPLDGGDDLVIMASQIYGRGRVVSFAVQDSWMWQSNVILMSTNF